MAAPARHHGLLLTFRRPDELVDHLGRVAAQTAGLDTLLVVDNANDDTVRALLENHQDAAGEIHYLGIDGNPGPAGGIAAGFTHVLERAEDHDWLVLLDDDDPPPRTDTFEVLRDVIHRLEPDVARIGGVGLWGATVRPTGRLRADTSSRPAWESPSSISRSARPRPGGASRSTCERYETDGKAASERRSIRSIRRNGCPEPAARGGLTGPAP